MTDIDLRRVGDTIVLHLRKEQHSINVYTLATTLVALADAAKEANSQLNPGYEIEVVVEALSDGSFKANVRAVYKSLENLLSKQALQAVILSVIANFIYEHTLSPDKSVKVIVNTDEVIIEQEDKRIIVPRTVYEAKERISRSSRFQEKIGEAFDVILKDPEIQGVSIDPDDSDEGGLPPIPRAEMERIAIPSTHDDDQQVVQEVTDLQIIRAILEKSRRRWEFSWKGVRIAAPILHDQFYQDFISHRITIAPGDTLQARLAIYQTRDSFTGIMINDRYEVLEVMKHQPASKHMQVEL